MVERFSRQDQEERADDVFVVVVEVVDGGGHDVQQQFELVVNDSGAIDGQDEVVEFVELGLDEDILVAGLFDESPENVLDTTDVQIEVFVNDDAVEQRVDLDQLHCSLVPGQVVFYFAQDTLGHFVPLVEVHFVF